MAWLTTDALPIQAGWGSPPQLQAPNIGGLVGEILQNRRWQQANTQKSIADAIKEYQQQRESSAYTEALQKAKLLPEGDYGGVGVEGGGGLAALIARQKAEQDKETHRQAMEARIGGGRGGRGGGGGGDTDTGGPEIIEHNGIQYQVIRTRNGVRYQRVPYQRPSTPSREERENIAPTMEEQTVYPDEESAPPSDTGSTIQPKTGGDAVNTNPPAVTGIAPSYEEAAPGQAYRAPDGTVRKKSG